MKFSTLLTSLGAIIFCLSAKGQANFNDARQYMWSLNHKTDSQEHLMTDPGINVFFAKKVNTYLAGASDLSLNKHYFILDPTDGRLFLGTNFAKDPSGGNGRTKWIFTAGVKTNVADAFSTIYSGDKKKFDGNIGASLKITLLGRGIIKYDKNKRQQQLNQLFGIIPGQMKTDYTAQETGGFLRQQIQNQLEADMNDDSAKFENSLKGLNGGAKAWAIEKRTSHFKSQNQKFRADFVTKEADAIDQENIYNSFWDHWLSLDLYLPFTRQSFDVAKDFSSAAEEKRLYNFEATLLYNHILEFHKVRLLGSLGLGVKKQSNVNTSMIDKYPFNDDKKISGTDTLHVAQLQSNDIYVGDYQEYLSPFIRFQFVNFFLYEKRIGLSFMAEKYLKDYNPLNLKLGLPVSLDGKDESTKVNFEIQFKWNDFGNNILPDKSRSDKFTVGLSVGIPLTSKIY